MMIPNTPMMARSIANPAKRCQRGTPNAAPTDRSTRCSRTATAACAHSANPTASAKDASPIAVRASHAPPASGFLVARSTAESRSRRYESR